MGDNPLLSKEKEKKGLFSPLEKRKIYFKNEVDDD